MRYLGDYADGIMALGSHVLHTKCTSLVFISIKMALLFLISSSATVERYITILSLNSHLVPEGVDVAWANNGVHL